MGLTTAWQGVLGVGARHTSIAVEVDGDVAWAVQLGMRRGGGLVLRAAARFDLPAGEDRIGLLCRALARRGFMGRRVHLAAGVGEVESDLIEVGDARAGAGGEAIEELAAATLARGGRAGGSVEAGDLEVAFWLRKAEAGAATVFAVGLRHETAWSRVAPFEAVGMSVERIGCGASALGELLQRFGHGEGCSAVLRLGWESHLLLLCEGRNVIYQRTLDAAGWNSLASAGWDPSSDVLPPAVRAHLSIVTEETAETLHCVPRTFPGLSVRRLLLTGDRADSQPLLHYCRQILPGLKPLDLSRITTPDDHASLSAGMDVALGLALSEVPQ